MSGIWVVLVSYNSGRELLSNLEAIVPQVCHVIIVDNGSCKATQSLLDELQGGRREPVTIIRNHENLGLSKAQNLGIRFALEQGAEWILLLDDDSTPHADMVPRMLAFHEAAGPEGKQQIGILYPNVIDKNTKIKTRYVSLSGPLIKCCSCPEGGSLDVEVAMASGSLIPAPVLERFGLMDEGFFIDQIDVDFSLRLRREGLRIVVVGDSLLFHTLGERTSHGVLGFRVTPTNHSAFRCYNIFRNRILIWRRYLWSNCNYIFFDLAISLYHVVKILCFEHDRRSKLVAILRGLRDGILASSRSQAG